MCELSIFCCLFGAEFLLGVDCRSFFDVAFFVSPLQFRHNFNVKAHIFTNDKVVKVIHDCQFMADAFVHRFGVKLNNVFDTQVSFNRRSCFLLSLV